MKKEVVLISACLLGIECRYDGKSKYNNIVDKLKNIYTLIPICPEQLGGLPTPRPPSEIINGDGLDVLMGKAKVVNLEGKNVTNEFLKGAITAVKIAQLLDIKKCFLKAKSPSCGIYKKLGVTAAMLIKSDFKLTELD